MKTKTILSMAIIAVLPCVAMAENISGAMYTAPSTANNTHPAPTTNASAPYGRIDIDTADQEHIATTAYVKGAYNSAIAAVNKVDSDKQDQLVNFDTHSSMGTNVVGANDGIVQALNTQQGTTGYEFIMDEMLPDIEQQLGIDYSDSLITAETAIKLYAMLNEYKQTTLYNYNSDEIQPETVRYDDIIGATDTIIHDTPNAFIGNQMFNDQLVTANEVVDSIKVATNYIGDTIDSKRVRIYTTWGTDTAAATTLVPFEMAQ